MFTSKVSVLTIKIGRRYATTLYKGISSKNEQQYAHGLQGIVFPTPTSRTGSQHHASGGHRNGESHSAVDRLDAASSHNWGKYVSWLRLLICSLTEFGWSSWTSSQSIAKLYASEGGLGGVILTAQVWHSFRS